MQLAAEQPREPEWLREAEAADAAGWAAEGATPALDPAAIGLSDFAPPGNYIERQVARWTRQYRAAQTDDIPDITSVAAWLAAHMPPDGAPSLIHNDYKFDNVIFDTSLERITGVLDWEMATVGDPLMDLSSTIAYWVEAEDDELFQLFRRQPTNAPGMWTRAELIERYAAATGREVGAEQALFLEVFGLFRLAVIAQQIWYRYVHRQTTNESYAIMGQVVGYLEQRCRRLIAG